MGDGRDCPGVVARDDFDSDALVLKVFKSGFSFGADGVLENEKTERGERLWWSRSRFFHRNRGGTED